MPIVVNVTDLPAPDPVAGDANPTWAISSLFFQTPGQSSTSRSIEANSSLFMWFLLWRELRGFVGEIAACPSLTLLRVASSYVFMVPRERDSRIVQGDRFWPKPAYRSNFIEHLC